MIIIKNLLEKYTKVVNAFLGRNFNVSDNIFGVVFTGVLYELH